MHLLHGGAAVIAGGEFTGTEGTRRYRVPVARAMGAHDIAQTISVYDAGLAPARRNPTAEEVLYVVSGEGACHLDGFRYELVNGVAVYVPPGRVCQIESLGALEIVSVCCPEDESVEVGVETITRGSFDTRPARVVLEQFQKEIATGDRTFKLLVSHDLGASRVTQFVGVIPPGRAPMHHHTYEEAIYIIEGEGRVWTESGSADFGAGASIYLPRGVSHSLENTGTANIRLLGVFHPSGSPAVRYTDTVTSDE
jgi:mannose-6-phosphate isomerase-like protein (cupin superfamily)